MDSDQKYESRIRRSDRVTQKLCRFITGGHGPCYEDVAWFLEDVEKRGQGFYVCDAHLAAGIRASGLPARIEAPEPDPKEKRRVYSSWKPMHLPVVDMPSGETE